MSVVAVTLSLYSIIYQVFILRKACMLCVLADFAVWGSAVALYILKMQALRKIKT